MQKKKKDIAEGILALRKSGNAAREMNEVETLDYFHAALHLWASALKSIHEESRKIHSHTMLEKVKANHGFRRAKMELEYYATVEPYLFQTLEAPDYMPEVKATQTI
jgi:hypothetical protein